MFNPIYKYDKILAADIYAAQNFLHKFFVTANIEFRPDKSNLILETVINQKDGMGIHC
jgi:hypothetical protein